MPAHAPPPSLRRSLLLGILLPIVVFVVFDTISLYQQAFNAVNTAYDRTLLASAKAIGELLDIERQGEQARLRAHIPYSALEAFETDNRSRMVYRVSDAKGQWIDGVQDLPLWQGRLPDQGPYAALVDFYDDTLRGDAVRVAVLLQPVASGKERTMATVQVAETLELRHALARQILFDTLMRQAILIMVVIGVVLITVQRVTRPVRALSHEVQQRDGDDLTPLSSQQLPREILPLTEAINQVMRRLAHLLNHQKRFVRDAAHQLRTPLAVLKVQVQSALRHDIPAQQALQEIQVTVDRATQLANQMLSLAKVEQLRQQQDFCVMDWSPILRAIALDLSPLIAHKNLDFEIQSAPCLVRAHEWMLREMVRNLLHNAISHSPPNGALWVSLTPQGTQAVLHMVDTGPGLSDALLQRLFEPFSSGSPQSGSGLGLTITREMVHVLQGTIVLRNRYEQSACVGLDACITLPLQPLSAHPTSAQ